MTHTNRFSCLECEILSKRPRGVLLPEEAFLCQVEAKFGKRYELLDYSGLSKPLTVICKIHGNISFKRANVFLGSNTGCTKCSLNLYSFEQFEAESLLVHSGKYSYEGSSFSGISNKVAIFCPLHGRFFQQGSWHLKGGGCQKCHVSKAAKASSDVRAVTFEGWVSRARSIHGRTYLYSKDGYSSFKEKASIRCPNHGLFSIRADVHINQSQGCPSCKSSKGERRIFLFLKSKEILFQRQYSLNEGRYKSGALMKFDFYLPDYRTFIEFDGIQHFSPVRWNTSITEEEAAKRLSDQINRDKEKDAFVQSLGFNMLRLNYTDDIEVTLSQLLKEKKNDA